MARGAGALTTEMKQGLDCLPQPFDRPHSNEHPQKPVFSRSGRHQRTEWNNTQQVVVPADDKLAKYLTNLKAQPGGDIRSPLHNPAFQQTTRDGRRT